MLIENPILWSAYELAATKIKEKRIIFAQYKWTFANVYCFRRWTWIGGEIHWSKPNPAGKENRTSTRRTATGRAAARNSVLRTNSSGYVSGFIYTYHQRQRFCEQHLWYFLMDTLMEGMVVQPIWPIKVSVTIDAMLNFDGNWRMQWRWHNV